MTDKFAEAYLVALDAMNRPGPKDLHSFAWLQADGLPDDSLPSDATLRTYLQRQTPDNELRKALHLRLAKWDSAQVEVGWTETTSPNTRERRETILRKLKVDAATAELFDQLFPVFEKDGTIVIADKWERWYTEEVRQKRDFYWSAYTNYLSSMRKWSPEAVIKLDIATTHVVERLSDPTRKQPYQAKGLVVGYVQSGKTANFTGVIAKAIDAGYRLIIVMTGTTNLLREQTQRRLDMELVGVENILRGVDLDNPEALNDVDYQDDRDWYDSRFVRHHVRPAEVGQPDIHRMTTHHFDYQSLRRGISALDFVRRDQTKPLSDPENLFHADARLVIVKKNSSVLKKLVKDLGGITARLHEVPALIIDDESDQASINTSNPKKWAAGKTERTTINKHIAELLRMLPRGQYVGYTATPFANVFVDPSDAEDIFPKDFLISLERPPGYMGASDFHDTDPSVLLSERTFANSREKAHVRLLEGNDDKADRIDLQRAIDAFVLSGAIKLYRKDQGVGDFRHHTMLVHEAMKTAVHLEARDEIRRIWEIAGYSDLSGSHHRLRALFDADLLPVTQAIGEGVPSPKTFDDLAGYIPEVARLISPNGNPVIVVNSDKDIEQDELKFDQHGVWRILVGGNKLARGFTVEGLTVSYYLRKVKSADALMQMGRWFGFRAGYRDLVRLYVTPDVYDAFESICLDEEDFRKELRRYAQLDDNGDPLVTPARIPPLVRSRGIRPAAASKMYNAVLEQRRTLAKEPSSGYPALSDKALQHNVEVFSSLLELAKDHQIFGAPGFDALVADDVSHDLVVGVLTQLKWANEDSFRPDLAWIKSLGPDEIAGWRVVLPQQKSGRRARFGNSEPLSLHGRKKEGDKLRGNSTTSHRLALDPLADTAERLGIAVIYPVIEVGTEASASVKMDGAGVEINPNGVVMAIRLKLPGSAEPSDRRILIWKTRDSGKPEYSMVDADEV